MAVTAAVIGIAATLGTTAYAVQKDHKAKEALSSAREDERGARKKLEEEAATREKQEAASRAQQDARKRQLAATSENYGRASTILTGPQGLGGSEEYLG